MPAVNRTQNVSIICDPETHRETAGSSEPPQFSCDTPFSFISERTGLNDTRRAATGYACEPIECSKADLLSGHWRAGYVASPVTMSPLFQRSSGSVMALLEVDSISCDEDAGYAESILVMCVWGAPPISNKIREACLTRAFVSQLLLLPWCELS